MNNKENFSLFTEKIINEIKETGKRPSLLLHVCCAPCSSYVLEYLSAYFDITVYFYNPNIDTDAEFRYRADEEKRFIAEMGLSDTVKYTEGKYNRNEFLEAAQGLESAPEGGERCAKCFELRLKKSAVYAKEGGFDYFTTTLSISPLKNSALLNSIGKRLSEKYGVKYLYSDFKKKNGYKRSVELSREHKLYRQSYCGCAFSKAQAIRDGRISKADQSENDSFSS
ncbi:MAG: epoxyqueuosine reductase QueH [Clostridia bacterium]|nr:epoxyqueuosine reductase QueH [Clostridia bacterium]